MLFNEDIKELLEKNYGPPRRSLIISSTAKRSNRIYYYKLPEGVEEGIFAVENALNNGINKDKAWFIELEQYFENVKGMYSVRCQCACFHEGWGVGFYNIKGIRYHISYGQAIVASLILEKHPVVYLTSTDKENFYGFWGGEPRQKSKGMGYWVNKNMLHNQSFRQFAADFCHVAACRDELPILDDVANTILEYGYFLPSLPFENLKAFHTKNQFVKVYIPDAESVGVSLNALDLNAAYCTGLMSSAVADGDLMLWRAVSAETVNNSFSLNMLFDGVKIEDLVAEYYTYVFNKQFFNGGEFDFMRRASIIKEQVRKYAVLCMEHHEKIRLDLTYDKLLEAYYEQLEKDKKLDNIEKCLMDLKHSVPISDLFEVHNAEYFPSDDDGELPF